MHPKYLPKFKIGDIIFPIRTATNKIYMLISTAIVDCIWLNGEYQYRVNRFVGLIPEKFVFGSDKEAEAAMMQHITQEFPEGLPW